MTNNKQTYWQFAESESGRWEWMLGAITFVIITTVFGLFADVSEIKQYAIWPWFIAVPILLYVTIAPFVLTYSEWKKYLEQE